MSHKMSNDRKRNANDADRNKGGRDDRRGGGGGDRNRRDRDFSRGGYPPQGGQGGPQGGQQRGGHGHAGDPLSGNAFTEAQLLSEIPKKKFSGRCRLFVGNLPNDMKEQELKDLFTPHGDISECYLSGKGFAFLRMDTRAHAESAKEALDGHMIQGRAIRVRFAVHGAAIKIKELPPVVSNEMLYHTFSAFGEVERAVHIVDEKGKPTGEGIIEFERKNSAMEALNQIRDRVFLITANSRPLQAEILEPKDDEDGLAERMIPRSTQLFKERELGPRFAALNSFEFVYGRKWKELYDMEKRRREELEVEFREARQRLEADMEIAYQDYQTQLLREELQRRQQELERLEAAKMERMRMMGDRPLFGGMMGGQGFEPRGPGGLGGPMGGPHPGMEPPMSRGGPPPPQHGDLRGPMGGGPGGPQGMLGGPPPQQGGAPQISGDIPPGVRSILQMFKNDASARPPPPRGGPGGPGGHGGPGGPHGGFFGGPPAPGGMFVPPPPEKRSRP